MNDTYTLKEIEAVVYKYGSHKDQNAIIAELTTPQFAEGQVVNTGGDGNWSYVRYESDKMDVTGLERPLNPQEVGPDWIPSDYIAENWVPRAEFEKLRDAVQMAIDRELGEPFTHLKRKGG
jgi:hypothetical protein